MNSNQCIVLRGYLGVQRNSAARGLTLDSTQSPVLSEEGDVHLRTHAHARTLCFSIYVFVCAYSTATTGGRPRVRFCVVSSVGSPAGVTWTSRTTSAPWAARWGHSTVIDAAGAIYVIGGRYGTFYSDVWVSTDGGAHRTRRGARGYYRGYQGLLRVLLARHTGVPRGTRVLSCGYFGHSR